MAGMLDVAGVEGWVTEMAAAVPAAYTASPRSSDADLAATGFPSRLTTGSDCVATGSGRGNGGSSWCCGNFGAESGLKMDVCRRMSDSLAITPRRRRNGIVLAA
jgi:hypothetical protein